MNVALLPRQYCNLHIIDENNLVCVEIAAHDYMSCNALNNNMMYNVETYSLPIFNLKHANIL